MESGPLAQVNGHNLREAQPVYATELDRRILPGVYGPPPQESTLHEYLRVLIKRKWTVLACAAGIFAVVAIATLRMTPVYEASGSVAVNKPDQGLLNFKDSPTVNVDYYDPTDLDTEVRVLQSDQLALLVIRQLNLDKRPEFGGSPATKPTNTLTVDPLQSDSTQTSELLGGFKGGLHVAAIPNSRIIEIHYRSTDPQTAASIVNTLANVYVEQNFKTKFESTMQTADWLSKQLVDLQMKVESSQEKLVRYQKAHDILGLDEKQNITTQKLDELNKELTSAESDRMSKESLYKLAQSGNIEALSAAPVAGAAAGTNAGSTGSTLLDSLRSRQADLKIQIAELSTQFGPAYPKVAQLNNQLKEVEAEIQTESHKTADRLHNQYLAALARENMLHEALNRQKGEANQLNESAIEYNLLKRDVETNRTLYEGLLERLKEAGITAGLRSSNVKIVNAARVPVGPSEPNVPRNLAFGLLLGLTSGIGLAFLLENLDNTVRTPEQAQVISLLPTLGMVPNGSRPLNGQIQTKSILPVSTASSEVVELVTQHRPQSQMAESYRAIRTSLLLSSLGGPPKVILVTSALPQEGKTTTSINISIVLAQKGVRVLLVDADMRRPSVHKNLGMASHTGLSNVLTSNATLEQAIVRSPIHPNLFILPAGPPPPNPAELLASADMGDLVQDLRGLYEHVVIDTPPTLSVTDAVVLSTRADSVVLVIRSGQTTKAALRRARDLLAQVNAKVTGVLLNAVDLASPDYYYYEYQGKYGSHYYTDDSAGPPQAQGSV
jgi:exopolysaccharide transport family protein